MHDLNPQQKNDLDMRDTDQESFKIVINSNVFKSLFQTFDIAKKCITISIDTIRLTSLEIQKEDSRQAIFSLLDEVVEKYKHTSNQLIDLEDLVIATSTMCARVKYKLEYVVEILKLTKPEELIKYKENIQNLIKSSSKIIEESMILPIKVNVDKLRKNFDTVFDFLKYKNQSEIIATDIKNKENILKEKITKLTAQIVSINSLEESNTEKIRKILEDINKKEKELEENKGNVNYNIIELDALNAIKAAKEKHLTNQIEYSQWNPMRYVWITSESTEEYFKRDSAWTNQKKKYQQSQPNNFRI